MDDEDAALASPFDDFIHTGSHLSHTAGCALAPMLIPHVANNDGRLLRIQGDRLFHDLPVIGVRDPALAATAGNSQRRDGVYVRGSDEAQEQRQSGQPSGRSGRFHTLSKGGSIAAPGSKRQSRSEWLERMSVPRFVGHLKFSAAAGLVRERYLAYDEKR
jgi:hypothetical protein